MKNVFFNKHHLAVGIVVDDEYYYIVVFPGVIIRKERMLKSWTKIFAKERRMCNACAGHFLEYYRKGKLTKCGYCYVNENTLNYKER